MHESREATDDKALFEGRLCELGAGRLAVIMRIDPDAQGSSALHSMGFREGACVKWVTGEDPAIVDCDGCCIALRKQMLGAIHVACCDQPCPRTDCPRNPARKN